MASVNTLTVFFHVLQQASVLTIFRSEGLGLATGGRIAYLLSNVLLNLSLGCLRGQEAPVSIKSLVRFAKICSMLHHNYLMIYFHRVKRRTRMMMTTAMFMGMELEKLLLQLVHVSLPN